MSSSFRFDYDVSLSFAGEDREYVSEVAASLRAAGIRVFYDEYEKAELWGKDLYEHLDDVYRHAAEYCVIFASQHYARKVWANHERRSAQARALTENREYILPARFDETEIPGLPPTIGYVDLRQSTPSELADLIAEKIGPRTKVEFLPPALDRLVDAVVTAPFWEPHTDWDGESTPDEVGEIEVIESQAHAFFNVLKRMTSDERLVVYRIFQLGCIAELPDNVHVDIDLLRRYLGWTRGKITRVLSRLGSLGFTCSTRTDAHHGDLTGPQDLVVLSWHLLRSGPAGGNATTVARQMVLCATDGYCEEHGCEALERLDFGQLSTATERPDEHEEHEAEAPEAQASGAASS